MMGCTIACTLFETAIGQCAIAWDEQALVAVRLPARDCTKMLESLCLRVGANVATDLSDLARDVIARVRSHLAGRATDYADVPLACSQSGSFEQRVLEATRKIPFGETTTYGALARRLGDPGLARAVGQALGRNPWPIVVPCHRVTAASGRMGGFSAPGGAVTKLTLLEIEGALAPAGLPLFQGAGD
jgi:methylated-DNA-[protein]-cysteine S-methyltransferase